ncbi:MAG TPA: ABC transporter ATP-binding protein [Acidimicrobiales bacterium]|nr:ABC transporter ATP-binding protein [Acidimicrobiales bacterium]
MSEFTATARALEPEPPMGAVARRGAAVSIEDLSKVHGHDSKAVVAIEDMSLRVDPGEFVCVIGASGCGKSTLLHLLAGLDPPTSGKLEVTGRHTALMFQEAALFPWLTAAGNVELALRLRGVSKPERRRRAAELLELVQLSGAAGRRPHELSGGMRQRVALARAFAQDADLLLMDEPFGALDAMTRDALHQELELLWDAGDFSVVFVTHNVREAVRLSDRVVLMTSRPGRVSKIFDVAIARPRRHNTSEVSELARRITDELLEEVRRHGVGR